MKTICTLFILTLTTALFAQNPITRQLDDFTTVKAFDRVVINLVKSETNKVVISGEDAEDVVVINKDGVLKIRMDFEKIFDGNRTFIHVHYTEIAIIDGNEGAVITTNELLEQDRIELRVQEGARITAGLQVKEANLRAVTGGILEISGRSDTQNVKVNTGGIYEGRSLETKTSNVKVQAGGDVSLFASEIANIKIRAGGDVYVYGNPDQVIKDRVFGGRVKIM
ncbi:head GIN domain-containing protein [Croceiramulus getboli]|nr:DUF2807 domain-containing protein [Flavobacteriaceae bacterium YJPT1-3]